MITATAILEPILPSPQPSSPRKREPSTPEPRGYAQRRKLLRRHCEEQSDEAIRPHALCPQVDCFTLLRKVRTDAGMACIPENKRKAGEDWVPAFAGMTVERGFTPSDQAKNRGFTPSDQEKTQRGWGI